MPSILRLYLLVTALVLVVGCGPDPVGEPTDASSAWALCESAAECETSQDCRRIGVEFDQRKACVDPCRPDGVPGCVDKSLVCCPSGRGVGPEGYCVPKGACVPADAGQDASLPSSDASVHVPDAASEPDAGSPELDAALPEPDAAAPGPDAGLPGHDAAAPGPDAAAPGSDAAAPGPDAAAPGPDAAAPGPDAAAPGSDAAAPGPDAAAPGPDAAAPGPDAAAPGPDAATPGRDAGFEPDATAPGDDAAISAPDAGFEADASSGEDTGPVAFAAIRLMASNLTSGNYQSYDLGHGIRLMQGVQPDIIAIQEFNYAGNTPADLQSLSEQVVPGSTYCRETGAQIPNGIISRWPILECGEWDDPYVDNRDFTYARIDIPGPHDLWVVSLHLLTASAGTRNNEATKLVQFIQAAIPAGDFLAIGGDLNTDTRTEPCFTTLAPIVVTAAPYPVDQKDNGGTNASRAKPYDHMLVDTDLHAFQVPTQIGASVYPSGLVLDSRVYTPLSEIAPALEDDSRASSMQHMGVVKDFLVPY